MGRRRRRVEHLIERESLVRLIRVVEERPEKAEQDDQREVRRGHDRQLVLKENTKALLPHGNNDEFGVAGVASAGVGSFELTHLTPFNSDAGIHDAQTNVRQQITDDGKERDEEGDA